MKKTLPFFTFSAVLIFSFAPNPSPDRFRVIFEKIDREVRDHSQAYTTLDQATRSIGHRLTGSSNGEKAEQLAYDLFRSYGFREVDFQPFEVEAWSRDTVVLSIAPGNSDNYREVAVVALAHSPVQAAIKGEIIDVGNGLADDFEELKDAVRGKVVLANIGLKGATGKKNIHRSEKTALAIRHGATGIIMVNQAPGEILLTGTASVTGSLIPIPAVSVSSNSGKEIRAWLRAESPLIAEIEMRNFSRKVKARNVVATLKGKSRDKIVIGGHLDSWDLATGAIDNGIGSFAVIDIARTFNALKIKPEKTIQFVMFMGEEQGLLGSKHFVAEAVRQQDINRIHYMLNLDMTNNPNGVNAFGRKEMEPFLREIGQQITGIDTSYKNNFVSRAGLHSDHQPFMLSGVPILGFTGSLSPAALQCYHANCDYFKHVDRTELEKTVRIASMYLYALANTPSVPAKKLNSTETRDLMVDQGLKQELILGNDWKW